jgi:alkylation response protein AidB-like acyl-CoA dehydrogenase
MVGGCLIMESKSAPPSDMTYILAPAASFEVEDTWHSNGLAGSGSHHYKASALFVPERHAFTLKGPPRFAGPLYADAGSATVFIPMAGTPLGLMRRAIEVTLQLAGERVVSLPLPPTPMRNLPRVKFALARAQMLYGAARAAVYESVGRYWDELVRTGHGSLLARRDMGLARIHAHRTAREVAQLVFDTVGAPAVYESLPLGSLLHDAIVINQHLGFNDGVVERLGGMMLGDSPDGAFV